MDLQQAKILLEKLTRLNNSMLLDEGNISAIEKDLMRSYIRDLYDTMIDGSKSIARPKVQIVEPVPQPKEPVIEERVEIIKKAPIDHQSIADEAQKLADKVAENARKAAAQLSTNPISVPTPRPKVVEQPKVVPVQAAPVEATTSNGSAPISSRDHEIEALFEISQAKQLSEKLSETPIPDLSKALGLNEKIFTINELFGGNKAVYEDTVETLNGFSNFSEAKDFLIDRIAKNFNWSSNEKRKKAKIFIKLVFRRYK